MMKRQRAKRAFRKTLTVLIAFGAAVLTIVALGHVVVGGQQRRMIGDQTTDREWLGVDERRQRGRAVVSERDVRRERTDV